MVSEEGVRQGEREGPAEGTRLEKVEPEEGAWPLEGAGLAEKARPEFGFAPGPELGKDWTGREWPAKVVRPEKGRPVEGTGSEERERPAEKVCPEKRDSVEGARQGAGLAKLVRPENVGPVEEAGPERERPEEGT